MRLHRRDVVNVLWALGLPFLIVAVFTIVGMAVTSRTSLMDLPQNPEGPTPLRVTVALAAWKGALVLSSAAGYVFAWRLFARRAIAIGVAVIYFPLMFYALAYFSFWVAVVVFQDGP